MRDIKKPIVPYRRKFLCEQRRLDLIKLKEEQAKQSIECECGGTKANTTHSSWCPIRN